MTYACYIGRVGGLAVALGIGAAIAGLGGTAHADETASTTKNSESGSTAGTVDTKGSGVDAGPSAPNGNAAGGTTSASTARSDAADRPVTTKSSSTDSAATDGDGPQVSVRSSSAVNGIDQVSDRSVPKTTSASASDAAEPPPASVPNVPEASSPVPQTDAPSTEPVAVQDSTVTQEGTPHFEEPDFTPAQNADGAPTTPVSAASTTPNTAGEASSESVRDASARPQATPLAAVTTIVSQLDVPSPAAPPTPTLLDVLALIGQEFARTFFNQTPTLAYRSTENTVLVDGRVVGNLRPVDPDSAVLNYTATDPTHGAVVIGPGGTFTYTPDAGYAGPDAFDVTVSDAIGNGFHIHGLPGLFNLLTFGIFGLSGDTSTQRVTVGLEAFERTVLASGLDQPTDFRFLPDGRILIAEKTGAIRIYENGQVRSQPLLVLSVNTDGEGGIDGFAADPLFQANGYIYVAYTTAAKRERLSRFTVVGNTAAAGSELVLVQSNQTANAFHHGGAVAFGADGKLYWGVGDNLNRANAQDPSTIHGKVLRINPDGTVPGDNPFVNVSGFLPQIYAGGFRNPYRFASTPTGQLLVADVGEASWEEVNLLTRGANYGWPLQEGACSGCGYSNPSYAYPHGGGAAISSVLAYTGSNFGASFQNPLFIADFIKGWIKVLSCTSDYSSCGAETTFDDQAGGTVQLIQGPDDDIYQLTYTGELVRISPTAQRV